MSGWATAAPRHPAVTASAPGANARGPRAATAMQPAARRAQRPAGGSLQVGEKAWEPPFNSSAWTWFLWFGAGLKTCDLLPSRMDCRTARERGALFGAMRARAHDAMAWALSERTSASAERGLDYAATGSQKPIDLRVSMLDI